ncbi:hypothetical protein RJ641_012417 [Dillenia turbinata]|uniref:AIPP2-like SPOC-like domain-containing protein n=1 Tax=Dillenia turbinata TaxID=194707 RepID=A0AAN8UTU9_9MAGN
MIPVAGKCFLGFKFSSSKHKILTESHVQMVTLIRLLVRFYDVYKGLLSTHLFFLVHWGLGRRSLFKGKNLFRLSGWAMMEFRNVRAHVKPQNCYMNYQSPHNQSLLAIQARGILWSSLGTGVGPNNDEVQDENSLSIGPAQMVIWKGMFDIANITPEGHLCRSCEGFVAHPAAIIACKAFDFSKQISGVIKLKLYPRSHDNLWPEKFQLDPPDWNDIALYFFPGCEESSKKQYAVLLKFMEENNLVLRSLIDHVELLICPSSLFPVDFQTLDGSFFMWGVFRSLEGGSTSATSAAHDSQQPAQKTCETTKSYKRQKLT